VAKLIQNESETDLGKEELECEEAIMQDKQRYGRVRTNMMKHLRAKHGVAIANKTLSRINKRISINSLRIKTQLTPEF